MNDEAGAGRHRLGHVLRLTRAQLDDLVAFANKFLGYRVELSDAGDGRVLMRVLDDHGVAAGEKVLEPKLGSG